MENLITILGKSSIDKPLSIAMPDSRGEVIINQQDFAASAHVSQDVYVFE